MESWRKHPTPENHGALHTPWVDWDQFTEWDWPYAKLGYDDPNALWSSLHTEFNCMPFAIQDPYGWHSDVSELALASDNKEEFRAALRKRRDERFKEIRAFWQKTRSQLVANPIIWKAPPRGKDLPWATFCRISRAFSFDTITGHFANYLVDDTNALYQEERDAREAEAAGKAPASSSASGAIGAPVASLVPPEQPGQVQQPTQDLASPPSPRPRPALATKTVKTGVTRTTKGPARSSRVEKPPPRQGTSKAKPREGIRRSARLQERVGRGGE
ncbi:hypothetical protein E0Z10_g8916 [Xylaria hypoxylon]|uniref:Uncharacterized protein n=1 Tax=Xylaria hypoxylon TaxID=37992 RepID=A0A4Z0YKF7_9PEZI|nr:hypothetical protein E0Z10_g8916 [Xylaria hypoxylon]